MGGGWSEQAWEGHVMHRQRTAGIYHHLFPKHLVGDEGQCKGLAHSRYLSTPGSSSGAIRQWQVCGLPRGHHLPLAHGHPGAQEQVADSSGHGRRGEPSVAVLRCELGAECVAGSGSVPFREPWQLPLVSQGSPLACRPSRVGGRLPNPAPHLRPDSDICSCLAPLCGPSQLGVINRKFPSTSACPHLGFTWSHLAAPPAGRRSC